MTPSELERAIGNAIDARASARHDPHQAAEILATAAQAWPATPGLSAALADASGLATAMVADALPRLVAGIDVDALTALHARDLGGTAAPPPDLVAHVLASNVPGLAVPAIIQAVLAGAPVVVKSGRRDPVSAPAFRDAVAAIDPALAATIVTVAWPRGSQPLDDVLLTSATITVLTGSDASLAALAPRARGRVVTFGTRYGIAIVDDDGAEAIAGLAEDIAMFEQRGCLSPCAVFVGGDVERAAERLAGALERLAARWPPGPVTVEERAARRTCLDDASWAGARIHEGPWGAVITEPSALVRPTCGQRTVRVQPLGTVRSVPDRLPPGAIECIATTGPLPPDPAALGVSRVCPIGRMQAPSIGWPRGGHPPLRMLIDAAAPPMIEDER